MAGTVPPLETPHPKKESKRIQKMFKSKKVRRELEQNNARALKMKKIQFNHDLLSNLDMLCYLELVVLYYADNSILLLLVRCFTQFILSHLPRSINGDFGMITGEHTDSTRSLQDLSGPSKRLVAQKVFRVAAITAVGSILMHIFWLSHCDLAPNDMSIDNINRYQHGHLLMSFVGEREFHSSFSKGYYLLVLDALVSAMQVVIFCINYSVRLGLSETIEPIEGPVDPEEANVKEFDGYQGNVLIYRFRPLNVVDDIMSYKEEPDEEYDEPNVDNQV